MGRKIYHRKHISDERISWISTPEGGEFCVEYHVSIMKPSEAVPENMLIEWGFRPMFGAFVHWGGVETHHSRPMYASQTEPSQARCVALGQPCYHDGSSLAASEFFEYWRGDDGSAFALADRWVMARIRDNEDAEPESVEVPRV